MTYEQYLYHHGILGQKWGIRRYQNKDGTLTPAGKSKYGSVEKLEPDVAKKKEIAMKIARGAGTAVTAAGLFVATAAFSTTAVGKAALPVPSMINLMKTPASLYQSVEDVKNRIKL